LVDQHQPGSTSSGHERSGAAGVTRPHYDGVDGRSGQGTSRGPNTYSVSPLEGRRMHAVASRTSPTTVARALFAGLHARYDRLAGVLSLGQDRRGGHEMIDHIAVSPHDSVLA